MKKNKLQLEKFRILSLKESRYIIGGTGGETTDTQINTQPTEPTGITGYTGPTGPTDPNNNPQNSTDPSGNQPTQSSRPCQERSLTSTGTVDTVTTTG